MKLFAVFYLALITTSNTVNSEQQQLPSIYLLIADDLGYGDVGYLNLHTNIAKTPQIDLLANSPHTIQLNRFHTEITCTPSRVAILTGRTPARDCVQGSPVRNLPLWPPNTYSIVSSAKSIGYATHFLGKFPAPNDIGKNERSWPSYMGYDTYQTFIDGTTYDYVCDCFSPTPQDCFRGHQPYGFFGEGLPRNFLGFHWTRWTRPCTQCASPNCSYQHVAPPGYLPAIMESEHLVTEFSNILTSSVQDQPLLVQVAFRSVHVPYVASPDLRLNCSLFICCNDFLGTNLTSKQLDYFGTVSAMDTSIGKILNLITQYRQDALNSLVIFFSDNGPEWPKEDGSGSTGGLLGMKRSLLKGGIRTPCLIYWPAKISSNFKSTSLTSLLDIPATMAAIFQIDPPVKFDGVFLLPLILEPTKPFVRSSDIAVCSLIGVVDVAHHECCVDIGYIEKTGTYKIIFPNPENKKKQTASDRILNPYGLYLVENESMNIHNATLHAQLLELGRNWVSQLLRDYDSNCKAYL